MTSFAAEHHPVLACAESMSAALKDVVDVDPAFMTAADKAAALRGLTVVLAQAEELRLRVLAAADDLADLAADRDPAAWLARTTLVDGAEARRLHWLAGALQRWAGVARAMREGAVNRDQAETVVRALDALPDDVGGSTREAAELRLICEAATFAPRQLRILGRRVVELVAPEEAEDHERRALEREETHAAARTRLTTRRRGDGTTDINICVADVVARRLLTYLEAFDSPRRSGVGAPTDDRRPYPQRLGHAFGAFLEAVDPARLPLHGGDATTVLVTIDHETLLAGLRDRGVAMVGDEPISAAQARRLACQAGIIPLVLGGDSVVLDQGRRTRLFTRSQRKALALTQPTCRSEGCDVPAAWCEAHHGNGRWADGAATDARDGLLLCSFHHHRAHDRCYDLTRLPDGSDSPEGRERRWL